MGKVGLDFHNKKIRALARGLQDVGGMDVIYTGLYRSMDEIVEEAYQQAVDLVGISTYTGSHMSVFPELRQALEDRGCGQIIIFGEGLMAQQEKETLKASGAVAEIFSPSASTETIIEWIRQTVAKR